MTLPRLVIGFALALLLAPRAPAQAELLHDTWFKVKVRAKGVQVEDDGSLQQAASKSVHYIHFKAPAAEGVDVLAYDVWSETAPDAWAIVDDGELGVLGTGDLLFNDWRIAFGLPDGNGLGGFVTGRIKIKTKKVGDLKKAHVKTFGGETWIDGAPVGQSTVDGVHPFAGSLKITGKTVPVEKLPFDPALA
jgi:hypothetical protein